MTTPYTYTAHDLLDKVLKFTAMTPDTDQWHLYRQRDNQPRLVRLQQIDALMMALVPESRYMKEVGHRIETILSGDFITQRNEGQYTALLDEIRRTIDNSRFVGFGKREINVSDLQYYYCDLLHYHIKLQQLFRHNSGVMEMSFAYCFPYLVTEAVSDAIGPMAVDIARLLAGFIDPQAQGFTLEELIAGYNYPTDDLSQIDVDWM